MIFQIIITFFAIFAISRSYLRFRNSTESVLEFWLWIVVWTSISIVVWVPELTEIPARYLGVGRGTDLMLYISVVFLFYSVYRTYSKIEKVEQDITKLARAIALGKKKK